jgi:hypothetical protein
MASTARITDMTVIVDLHSPWRRSPSASMAVDGCTKDAMVAMATDEDGRRQLRHTKLIRGTYNDEVDRIQRSFCDGWPDRSTTECYFITPGRSLTFSRAGKPLFCSHFSVLSYKP